MFVQADLLGVGVTRRKEREKDGVITSADLKVQSEEGLIDGINGYVHGACRLAVQPPGFSPAARLAIQPPDRMGLQF
ncbi:hypothetical protein Tco_0133298 [Tanacetum coccineum]